jgi:hypothetical protein
MCRREWRGLGRREGVEVWSGDGKRGGLLLAVGLQSRSGNGGFVSDGKVVSSKVWIDVLFLEVYIYINSTILFLKVSKSYMKVSKFFYFYYVINKLIILVSDPY